MFRLGSPFFPALWRQVCVLACTVMFGLSGAAQAGAEAEFEAEAAARAMVKDQEKAGYVFRADAWVGTLQKAVGKAVRVQLFKGNDYCICVAVPRKSGIHITGEVLDFQGKPVGEIQPVLDGWGFLLFFKPKQTGVYVVTMRQTDAGKQSDTSCAMLTGYK